MPWRCFLTEPSDFVRRSLRRYAGGSDCSGSKRGYHNAEVVIDPQAPAAFNKEGGYLKDDYEGDPRWPARCDCGYTFAEEDRWQVNVDRLYRGAPDGDLYIPRKLPIGGLWDARWLDHPMYKGPDGRAWCVMMPGGQEWIVYGPSSDGKPWAVNGVPPKITVSPSIAIRGYYHGFVKNGVITEDVDGRKFEGVPRTA